jgi:peptidoglycan/LPS O-acetylase OafA/YrhL
MDGATFVLPLFLLAIFAGAFVAGLSGFAFGLVPASLWLSLIVGFGLLVQGYSLWKLRGALNWRTLLPPIVGAILVAEGQNAMQTSRLGARKRPRRNGSYWRKADVRQKTYFCEGPGRDIARVA